jgi:hypothetical protein
MSIIVRLTKFHELNVGLHLRCISRLVFETSSLTDSADRIPIPFCPALFDPSSRRRPGTPSH